MGRSKKGKAISGWVIVDKPPGITSTSVVNKVKWAFEAQKAGHAGTLDPAATGVLAVALGEATKTVPYVTDAEKCYRFMVRFGASTDTDDAEGQVLDTRDARPTDAQIEHALQPLRGDILQIPPQYSAVKVEGERAYDLAREGIDMTLAARPLTVSQLHMVARADVDHAEFDMVCGKGGYVRSIARDLGMALGCLGHVAWLRRVWSGPFDVGTAVTLDQIEAHARNPSILQFLRPLEIGLTGLPEMHARPEDASRLRHGNEANVTGPHVGYDEVVWASSQGEPVAVGHYRGGMLYPSRVFVPASTPDMSLTQPSGNDEDV
jgi:tRNA pseudouridine55 synthase